MCVFNYIPIVWIGEAGYNKILDYICSDKIRGFTRIVMVSPLYGKLLRLVLCVFCTCNCFDEQWVKN